MFSIRRLPKDFANYLELYYKYRTDYQIDAVLNGHIDDILVKKAAHATFDEKLSVTGILLSRLNDSFGKLVIRERKLETLLAILKAAKEPLLDAWKQVPLVYLTDAKNQFEADAAAKKKAGLCFREDLHHDHEVLDTLEKYLMNLKKRRYQKERRLFPCFGHGLMMNGTCMIRNLTRHPGNWNMHLILWKALLQGDRSW